MSGQEIPGATEGGEYPHFSDAEYARRIAEVDVLRATAGVDAVVIYGSTAGRHGLQFLTAFAARQEGYLVASPDEPPALFVQLFNHVPNAREMSVVERVAWGGTDSAATVAQELGRRAVRRVGLVGAIPYQAHGRLARALPAVEFVDLTSAFRRMRLVKSDEEIAWTRQGAALCDAAMRALVAEARPGMLEFELGALVEYAYGRLGGSHGICFLATAPMSGGGRIVPAQNWSRRPLREGDAILIELSAGIGGYTGQVLRTIAIGEPPAAYVDLHSIAEVA